MISILNFLTRTRLIVKGKVFIEVLLDIWFLTIIRWSSLIYSFCFFANSKNLLKNILAFSSLFLIFSSSFDIANSNVFIRKISFYFLIIMVSMQRELSACLAYFLYLLEVFLAGSAETHTLVEAAFCISVRRAEILDKILYSTLSFSKKCSKDKASPFVFRSLYSSLSIFKLTFYDVISFVQQLSKREP